MRYIRKFFRLLGPGVITGAADDDPSGIATYSQTGAQFGYSMLWTALFMLPLQTAIQEASARIGAVTGKGIAAVIKEHYSKKILFGIVFLVLIANTINIGADIGAMAEAAKLIVPFDFVPLAFTFTAGMLILEVFVSYRRYARFLKWLSLSLIAYPMTVFMVTQPWWTLFKSTFVPYIEFNYQFLFIMTGVLGTTISPYLFFWQASEEVEERRVKLTHQRVNSPASLRQFIHDIRIDNFIGMLFSEIGTWSIIAVSATVLHSHGITDIATAADAAQALEPLVHTFPHAGYLAKCIFAVGIIGLGLLSIPVLAGSAAYALGEALHWRTGLSLKLKKGFGFYSIIILSTFIGLFINFIGIDPIKGLVYAAVLNGVIAVPLIFIIALIAKNEEIMGEYKSGALTNSLLWITFVSMAIAAIAMLVTFYSTVSQANLLS